MQLQLLHQGKTFTQKTNPVTPISKDLTNRDKKKLQKAYIGVYPEKDQVSIHGKEHTAEHQFGKKYGGDHYCKTCSVFVFATVYGPPLSVFDKVPPERKEHVMAVYHKNMNMLPLNVRCLEGLDISALNINKFDYGDEDYELPD